MTHETIKRTFSPLAFISFVLGLTAIVLQFPVAVLALAFGLIGLREINRSDGRIHGRRFSIAGMFLGALVLLVDLIALGAYAVVRLRQTSIRAECQNNLRQLGMASAGYLADHKTFPPGTVRNKQLQPDERLSWLVTLVPYYIDMEASLRRMSRENTKYFPIDSGIDRSKSWSDPANREATSSLIRALICPGHPAFEEDPSPGPTYYVGIAGLGADAASLPADDIKCGLLGYDRVTTPNEITRGESYTMLACETAYRPGPWAQGGFDTVRGVDPTDFPFTGSGRPFGGIHPGVANLLMADGSVQVFRDDGLPKTFADMATFKVAEPGAPNR
jgi:prepilin-type processing-associated H-X9-DG protein